MAPAPVLRKLRRFMVLSDRVQAMLPRFLDARFVQLVDALSPAAIRAINLRPPRPLRHPGQRITGAGQCRSPWGQGVWLLPHAAFTPGSLGVAGAVFAATVCALDDAPAARSGRRGAAGPSRPRAFSGSSQSRMRSRGSATRRSGSSSPPFMFARGIIQTRLGERIAYQIIRRFGGSAIRLGYSIVVADLVMAPMTPSNTARAGGILFPITLSVARAFGSEPGPTAALIGAFLMTAFRAISSYRRCS